MQVEAAELGLESSKNVEMIFPVAWNQTSKLEHQSNCRCHSSAEHTARHRHDRLSPVENRGERREEREALLKR